MAEPRPKAKNCRLVLTLLDRGGRVKVEDAHDVVLLGGRYYLVKADFHGGHGWKNDDIEEMFNYAAKVHTLPRRIVVEYATETQSSIVDRLYAKEAAREEASGLEDDIPF